VVLALARFTGTSYLERGVTVMVDEAPAGFTHTVPTHDEPDFHTRKAIGRNGRFVNAFVNRPLAPMRAGPRTTHRPATRR
jgi:hypothetical protein